MVVDTSRAITDVAREYGVHDTTLGKLGPGLQGKHGGEAGAPLTLPERARLRELERENRELQMPADQRFSLPIAGFRRTPAGPGAVAL